VRRGHLYALKWSYGHKLVVFLVDFELVLYFPFSLDFICQLIDGFICWTWDLMCLRSSTSLVLRIQSTNSCLHNSK